MHLIKDNCIFFSFQTPVIPLYLGADLFSNTDIRTENHPRHHAKFAKKGLATKVNFSSGDMFDGWYIHNGENKMQNCASLLFVVLFKMHNT